MGVVPLHELKDALNITTSGSDAELQRRLDEGEAEYLEWVGPLDGLPANHKATIVADVAELWSRTQRGGGSGRPSFGGGGAGDFDDVSTGRPLVLFPRIRALAANQRQALPQGAFPPAEPWPCT